MRKRTMFWGIFILALALIALPLVMHSSATSVTPKAPKIDMPNALTGQVGVAFNTNLYLTGTGYPLPTLSVTPGSQNGISVSTNNLGSTGISSYASKSKDPRSLREPTLLPLRRQTTRAVTQNI